MDTDLLIGSLLKKFEKIDSEEVEKILEIQKKLNEKGKGKKLGEIAKEKGLIETSGLKRIVKKQENLRNEIYHLKNYEIREKIASGGMGVIYKAIKKDTGELVAIKILSPDLSSNPKYMDRFRAEMQIISNLRHPNLVSAIDSGEINELLFFVMEYVDGTSSYELMKKNGPLKERDVLKIGRAIAKVLCYLNDHGIIHRDIKPQNILITKDGEIKLCDLGTAKDAGNGFSEDTTFTAKGNVIGTPLYMSPEQAMGRKLDIKSDIYSLGVTLYHLAAGEIPLSGGATEIMLAHVRDKLPPPKSVNPKLTDSLNSFILKLITKPLLHRIQTPIELLIEINRRLEKPANIRPIRKRLRKARLYCKYYKKRKSKAMIITTIALFSAISLLVLFFLFQN